MTEPLAPELEQKARELAARIRTRSEESILEIARRLVSCTDETLFGDTEFALRDQALGLVAHSYAEHLDINVHRSYLSGFPSYLLDDCLGLPGCCPEAKRKVYVFIASSIGY